eukprot:6179572-Pyramimonas_sp.AAC.1
MLLSRSWQRESSLGSPPSVRMRLSARRLGEASAPTSNVIMMRFSAMAKKGPYMSNGSERCKYTRDTCTVSHP